MNRVALLLLCTLAGVPALAQDAAEMAAERQRIAQERAQVEAAFAEREKACYQKFAVNDCINSARRVRRDALADLRRQEIGLDDQERRRRAAERLRELEEKAAERDRRLAEPPKAPDTRDRTPQPGGKPRAEPRAVESPQPKGQARARAPKERDLPDIEENLRRDQQRRAEARERRERVERRNAENPQTAAPLPVPP